MESTGRRRGPSPSAAAWPSDRWLHVLCLDPSLTGCGAVLLPLSYPSLLIGEEAVRAGVQQCARNMGTCVLREVQQGAGRSLFGRHHLRVRADQILDLPRVHGVEAQVSRPLVRVVVDGVGDQGALGPAHGRRGGHGELPPRCRQTVQRCRQRAFSPGVGEVGSDEDAWTGSAGRAKGKVAMPSSASQVPVRPKTAPGHDSWHRSGYVTSGSQQPGHASWHRLAKILGICNELPRSLASAPWFSAAARPTRMGCNGDSLVARLLAAFT